MKKLNYSDRIKKWYLLRDSIEEESKKRQTTLAIYDLPNGDLEMCEFKNNHENMILLCKYPKMF